MISGQYTRHRRKAGTGAPVASAVFESIDDQIRATITSPTGRALLQLPDGSTRWIEGVPLPGAASGAMAGAPVDAVGTAAAHPLAQVHNEFPEVAQVGSRAHRRFHRAFRKAGSRPEHALHVARAVLR